jgi:hypothetical protein
LPHDCLLRLFIGEGDTDAGVLASVFAETV